MNVPWVGTTQTLWVINFAVMGIHAITKFYFQVIKLRLYWKRIATDQAMGVSIIPKIRRKQKTEWNSWV